MNEKEQKMIELVREVYKLAKEESPETTFLAISVSELLEDGERVNLISVNNNYWEIDTAKIDIRGDLE